MKYKRKQRAFLYNFNYPNKHFDFLSSLQSWAIVEHILLQKGEEGEEGEEGEGREESREREREEGTPKEREKRQKEEEKKRVAGRTRRVYDGSGL